MTLDPQDLRLLHECVLTRIAIFDDLITQENSRPPDQRGLLAGFISQLTELQHLSNRIAHGISETHQV
jgi:hypothetical protein